MTGDPVRVEGLGAFIRAMKQAEADLDEFKAATQRAGEIVVAAAQSSAPRRSGRLAASGRASKAARKATVRFGSARVPYAGPIHWGWPRRGIAPRPFAVEAARSTEPVWLAAYARELEGIADKVEAST